MGSYQRDEIRTAESYIEGSPITLLEPAKFGRLYATTANGMQYTKRGDDPWQRRRTSPPPGPSDLEPSPLNFYLVMQTQAGGKEDHWCLFVAREAQPGTVYQVLGNWSFESE